MHNVLIFCTCTVLILQLLPRSFAALPIPKAPEVAPGTTAGEGAAGNAAGNGPTGGGSSPDVGVEGEGEGTTGGTTGGFHPGADNSPAPGSTGVTNNEDELGKIFELILDIIQSALPSGSDSPTATIIPAPIPTAQVTNPNARACLQANSIYSGCLAATSGFDVNNNPPYQASCLCYWTSNGMVAWQPSTYDGWMSSCYHYVNSQTVQATAASGVRDQSSLCTSVGDVKKVLEPSISSGASTPSSTAGSSPSATGRATSVSVGKTVFFTIAIVLGRALAW
ncbi:MAG: hypothetical protein LQ338_001659 [Usnochroma carphineum]|nr:MAG: hypothetical protein LQ338_001659 [Usnochroma carphineum]